MSAVPLVSVARSALPTRSARAGVALLERQCPEPIPGQQRRLVIIAGLLQRFGGTRQRWSSMVPNRVAMPPRLAGFSGSRGRSPGGRVAYAWARYLGILGFKVVENGLQDLSATLIQQEAEVVLEGQSVRRSRMGATRKRATEASGDPVAEGAPGRVCGSARVSDGLELMQNGGGQESRVYNR